MLEAVRIVNPFTRPRFAGTGQDSIIDDALSRDRSVSPPDCLRLTACVCRVPVRVLAGRRERVGRQVAADASSKGGPQSAGH